MKRTINNGLVFLGVVLLASACGPNERILQSANENTAASETSAPRSNSTPTQNTFGQDVDAMRTADFKFILAFRRRDGALLDSDDKTYLAGVIPSEINRRKLSDSGRAVIIGSNFRLPPETMKVLKERFVIEDLSPPDGETINTTPEG